MTDQRMSAIQDLLQDLSDQNLQGLILAAVNEKGDLETVFFGSAEKQTFLTTILNTYVNNAVFDLCLSRQAEKPERGANL